VEARILADDPCEKVKGARVDGCGADLEGPDVVRHPGQSQGATDPPSSEAPGPASYTCAAMLAFERVLINGQWVRPHGAGHFDIVNPTTEEVCGRRG
jgi:hypothetical protein